MKQRKLPACQPGTYTLEHRVHDLLLTFCRYDPITAVAQGLALSFGLLTALLFGCLPAANAQTASPLTNDYSPMWSPDGKRIVFASDRSGDGEIYVMDADGTDVLRLTHRDGYDADPAWSPDGSKIAFCTDRDGNQEIYVMDVDGSNPRNLSNHPASDCATPSWSPDGKKLTFVSTRDGDWKNRPEDNYEIYVMNADGSGQTRLTHSPGYDLSTGQAWTPDGEQIIFCSSGEHPYNPEGVDIYANFDIYRIDADGKNLTQLTFSHEEDSYPFLSPDGEEIYYSRLLKSTGTGYDLYRMTSDGKTITRVTDLPHLEGVASWSPDGTRIVYQVSDGKYNSLFVANADGSSPVKITNR